MVKIFTTLALSFSCMIGMSQSITIGGLLKRHTDSIIYFEKNSQDAITGKRDGRFEALVSSDGRFSIDLPSKTIDEWSIKYGGEVGLIHMKPGDKIFLTIDSLDYYSGFKISSNRPNDTRFMQVLFNDSTYNTKFDRSYSVAMYKTKNLDSALMLRRQKSTWQMAFVEKFQKSHPMSDDYFNWLKNQFVYEPFVRLALENVLNASVDEISEFLSVLGTVDLNNEKAALASVNYNELVLYFCILKTSGNLKSHRTAAVFDFGLSNLAGATRAVLLTRQLLDVMPIDSIFNRLYPRYSAVVKDKVLLDIVSSNRRKYEIAKTQEHEKKNSIESFTELSQVFKKYSGKVIYVDFWASWCAPCRAEMPDELKLQQKYNGKNVVFLFLGYDDTKLNWLVARNELKLTGEHILLTKKMVDEATKKFKISGIPHYAIISPSGEVLNENAQRPSDPELVSTLNSLLK